MSLSDADELLCHVHWHRRRLEAERSRLEQERARLRRERIQLENRRHELEMFFHYVALLSGTLAVIWTGRALARLWRWAWRNDGIEIAVATYACWDAARTLLGLEMGNLSWRRYLVTYAIYLPLAVVLTLYRRIRIKTDYKNLSARVLRHG
jgi:hypothetical protein